MKGNFLLEKSLRETIEPLSNEEKGKLFQGILDYVNGIEPSLTGALKSIFIPIKKEIDSNEAKYQKRCETNQENGSKGGAPKGNQNARKKNNQDQIKTTENNPTVNFEEKNNRKQHDTRHSTTSSSTSYITNQEKDNKGVIGGKEEKTIYDVIQEEYGRNISPMEYEIINNWLEQFNNELVLHAIKESVANEAKSLRYTERILERYRQNNIKTVSEAQKAEEEFRKNKSGRNGKKKYDWEEEFLKDV